MMTTYIFKYDVMWGGIVITVRLLVVNVWYMKNRVTTVSKVVHLHIILSNITMISVSYNLKLKKCKIKLKINFSSQYN